MSDSSGTQQESHSKPGSANEEYTTLVNWIKEQKAHGGDDEENDGSKIIKKRSMWTPWKTREVRVDKNGEEQQVAAKVPASW